MATTQADPYLGHCFRIEIQGIDRGGFSEVSGLDISNDVIEYRNGDDKSRTVSKLFGLTKYSNIVLKGGLTDDRSLFDWKDSLVKGKPERKDGCSIVLWDTEGNEKMRWNFRRAWIVKWSGPSFNATANSVAIESVELAHEGLTRA